MHPRTRTVVASSATILLALAVWSPGAFAQATSKDAAQPKATTTSTKDSESAGILPVPDYTGDFWTRNTLLGDLNGGRTRMAEMGIQFGINYNQTVQSVVGGGRDIATAYGGTADYNLKLDLMRMGILPGALVQMRGESRYGESVNLDAGPLLAVNTDFLFPLTQKLNERVNLDITTLSYTQFLSDTFGVFMGKFDTLDGDPNEFAGGRGIFQFQNLNFVFSPAMLVTVPYSTLGGGIIWRPDPHIVFASSFMNTTDSSSTSGFDDIGDGWTWSGEVQLQYQLGHLPGGANIGGSYAWDNKFLTIGRHFAFELGQGITQVPNADTSWSIYVSAWQYLFAEEPAENADAPLDLTNGRPDRKGLGLFARMGFADQDTNPFKIAFSVGIGGMGAIPGRGDDTYGVGYYYNDVQSTRLSSIVGAKDHYQGVEAFYNIALTPAAGLTFDLQVVQPPTDNLDTATVLGMRLLLQF